MGRLLGRGKPGRFISRRSANKQARQGKGNWTDRPTIRRESARGKR